MHLNNLAILLCLGAIAVTATVQYVEVGGDPIDPDISKTCHDVKLEFDPTSEHVQLHATCETSIDLDQIIGNNNGTFQWGGRNWSRSSAAEAMTVENNKPILNANLWGIDERSHPGTVNLGDHIQNSGGKLVYVP
ncbi:hypothetical protein DFQ26_003655 [Actinomortierella ambigua]|nr:hypothetical protein DFQ26_003655 [Actinomortierella ambigua]